jgi:hypothetical protein
VRGFDQLQASAKVRLAVDASHVRDPEAGDRLLKFYAVDEMRSQPFHDRIHLCYASWRNHVCRDISGIKQRLLHLSDHNPLDLIETHFVAPAIIELRRARRGMVCHRGGLFKRAAVLEIGSDPGRPEAVIAELGFNAGRRGAPAATSAGTVAPFQATVAVAAISIGKFVIGRALQAD